MILNCRPHDIPGLNSNRFYLDYIADQGRARHFFTLAPLDFVGALAQRRTHSYPRQAVVDALRAYHEALTAGPQTLQNIAALAAPETWCVISGQQAGFLGGPAYTAYKIITAIRLAQRLQAELGTRVVPLFWLASEDHDLAEVNHSYFQRPDGEIAQARFDWADEGRPIADLPVTAEVRKAYDAYFAGMARGPHWESAQAIVDPGDETGFARWQARIWLKLFASQGLIVVEPHLLRQIARPFFLFALEQSDEIHRRLANVAQELQAAGYTPSLDPTQNGSLFTFNETGRRVRVNEPTAHIAHCQTYPERYSTDAALRPLLADALLPTLVSVLGPGETAYQGMLKPLYELFRIPQPAIMPRQSYTVLGYAEWTRLKRYGVTVEQLVCGQFDLEATYQNLIPATERALFDQARAQSKAALAPLKLYLAEIDPALARTWEQTAEYNARNIDKLEEKAFKARLSRAGVSRQELRTLQNLLTPRGRPQEREFALPYLINRYGPALIEHLFGAGELDDFSHHILIVEESA